MRGLSLRVWTAYAAGAGVYAWWIVEAKWAELVLASILLAGLRMLWTGRRRRG